MNVFENIEAENKQIVSDLGQLAGTEDSRLSVITAIFIRANNEMRLKNIQDIRKDISYGAKDFGQLPEVYVGSMESIVRSYIEETNKFMKAYNDEFKNIQNILKNAEEKQKYYFFKIRESIVMKNICALAGKQENEYSELDEDIKKFKRKLVVYEKIILRCDKQFEECKNRREQDFRELFEIKKEQALAVIQKRSFFDKILYKIKKIFSGYETFQKVVLQKHAIKINRMKTETMNEYVIKEKQNELSFSNEINAMLANS